MLLAGYRHSLAWTLRHPALVQRIMSNWSSVLIGTKRIVGLGDSLGDRRIDEVVLVRLSEWLHILRRHQPYLVTLLLQRPAEEMRFAAVLHADQLDA